MIKYMTILADPPWSQGMCNAYTKPKSTGTGSNKRPKRLSYPTMSIDDICALPVGGHAAESAHLWLWTTNQYLRDGFRVMEAWGFKYLAPITWVKPSGLGNYFVHRTQTLLFGYREKCRFPLARYRPTVLFAGCPKRHSEKPAEAYDLIEAISPAPRLELFARGYRPGWDVWGNEVESTVGLAS